MLLDPVIVSCCPRTRAHTHTDCLWLSPVWQIKLTFNRFHGDQNKAFLYWQHSVSQTPCVLFHCSIVGTFMTEEQAPTPSRVLPDASMTWLIFFLHGHRPTSCQPLFASHQITFWRRWRPKNVFSRSELMSLTSPPHPQVNWREKRDVAVHLWLYRLLQQSKKVHPNSINPHIWSWIKYLKNSETLARGEKAQQGES